MKTSKSLPTVILSTVVLMLTPLGHAQGNLVNLNDWTLAGLGLYQGSGGTSISTFASTGIHNAQFTGVPSTGDGFVSFSLTGDLNTTPGVTYEIAFTMQNAGQYYLGNPSMSFGSFTTSCNLLAGETRGDNGYQFAPQNYVFSLVATDPITSMSFTVVPDVGQAVFLSNVSVTQMQVQPVPESSSTLLFGFGACVFALVRSARRFWPLKAEAA